MKITIVGVLALIVMCSAHGADQRRGVSFGEVDSNSDGRVSVTEASATADLNRAFATADHDRDAYISESEFQQWVDSLSTEKMSYLNALDTVRLEMVRIDPPRPGRW